MTKGATSKGPGIMTKEAEEEEGEGVSNMTGEVLTESIVAHDHHTTGVLATAGSSLARRTTGSPVRRVLGH